MDFLSIFRSSPEKQIQKLRKKVKEPHGDASVRVNAAFKLRDMGTPEAILALLDRFTISTSPSVQDEEEKEQVLSWIIGFGDTAIDPIVAFLKRERQVYWPLRALRRIVSEDRFASIVGSILKYHWENPPATTEPQTQMIRAVQGLHQSELEEAVRPYLEERNDDVLVAALDYLFEKESEESRQAVLECYLESEDRPRVRTHILDRLAQKEWNVKGYRPRVEETLPAGYTLTREGVVKSLTGVTGQES